jgi:multisubunit Na+/H+ antiporter MnhC subunit
VLSGLWALYLKLFENTSFVQTPLPLVLVMTAIMGFMCILMGLLAELLTRTYHESQDKPVYLVKETRNVEPALVRGGPVHALVE